MTSLLGTERDPGDCPHRWGQGYDPCSYHDLPVHKCLIQSGHDHPCICLCGTVPPPSLPRPQRFRWTGKLDDSPERITRHLRRARRDARYLERS